MIKILAIGNSFSQDATAYLHDIAKAAGKDTKVVNLYIGGCSLETHWNNIVADAALYDYELNGQSTGSKISIRQALQEEAWDYVTLQQVSGDSGILSTYDPYLGNISKYVREYAPGSEQLLHQTWAYEIDSDHPDFAKYHKNQGEMYRAITEAYHKLAKESSLRVIPSGKVIQELRALPAFDYPNGGISLCRDGFHMNCLYGRYALAATWFEFILQDSIIENTFLPGNGEEVDRSKIKLIKETIHGLRLFELLFTPGQSLSYDFDK
ncbi:MAG TPA: DUF4886 domain-containing protein [Lachnospiraceae bacterium]|jgi:hypothetical protein|nr:DUF4886 domain-containing protein [Lachnospiraceae bacterium]HCM12402.1 DUF4886 domain-containing protein [Lachnospiraceae bacterium]HCR39777.1 DUF4886 domain-containing protein [Lachnospiraceae bacterium]